MMKLISVILILVSSGASISYSYVGMVKPETTLVYNKAKISHLYIKLLPLFLGIGGLLLLLPQTFKLGGTILIVHSVVTIICFILIRDWRGGAFEFVFLQIPIFILWAGYPILIIEKLKNFLTGTLS
ncbi:MAG TPA: hypothetical protein VFE50_16520 [Cyclobacteriaceae bacterium]|nr:hypothetical protein [Cyclobacteriaceae bacterium]